MLPWYKMDADERAGAPVLVRELGIWRSIKLGRAVRRELAAGEPFAALPPPDCEEERLSRAQIGRAIVLFRLIAARDGEARALDVTRKVVIAAACRFLGESLGPLDRATIAAVPVDERESWVQALGAKFFNATTRWDRIDDQAVEFTVTSCRFPRLCAEVGVPQLAPVFCAGDERYFGTVEPDVVLERPGTIAGGAPECTFKLRYR